MKNRIDIAVIEDHPEYREMIEMLLEDEEGLFLNWKFGSAEWALRRIHSGQEKCQPDVILLDLGLPGMSGLEAIPELLAMVPDAKIIVVSQLNQEKSVINAITLGASGFLLKSATAAQIIRAVHEVDEGGNPLDARVAGYLLKNINSVLPSGGEKSALTNRELEVLELVSEGLVKKEIGGQLGIGESTVVSHVKNIYEKLGAANAPAAVAQAYRRGLLPRK